MAELTPDARFAVIEERLGTGAQAFAELRGKLGRLAWWALGLVTLVIGIAFAAGQVVVEVREARSVQHEIKGELGQLRDTAATHARRQDELEKTVKAIDTKLDRALAPEPAAGDPITGRRRHR